MIYYISFIRQQTKGQGTLKWDLENDGKSRKYSWIQLTFSFLSLPLSFPVSQSAVYLLQVSRALTLITQ